MKAFLFACAVLLMAAPAPLQADEPLLMGTWALQAQMCAGCALTTPVDELSGSMISISPTRYEDSILGTDICPGAAVFDTTKTGALADVIGPASSARIAQFIDMRPTTPARAIDITCAVDAKAPYTGKVLARVVSVEPSTLIYLWKDDILLFTRALH